MSTTDTLPRAAKPRPTAQAIRRKEGLRALPWVTPTLALIVGVVLFPAGLMVYTSFFKYNNKGIRKSDEP
ncbi:MAG TPA: hypothetical protein PKE42_07065, partial [Arachnia sp.]|nr:hypothetical protein [Arachnia sp.]